MRRDCQELKRRYRWKGKTETENAMGYNQAVKLNCREVFDQLVNFSRHLITLIESASQKPSPWSQVYNQPNGQPTSLKHHKDHQPPPGCPEKTCFTTSQRSFSMRFELIALLTLSTCQLALACCGNKDLTSCCGKGKCNIFCCNCDGGKSTILAPAPGPIRTPTLAWVHQNSQLTISTGCDKSCKPVALPICWAWEGGSICDNPDGSTSWSGSGGPKVPKPKPQPIIKVDENIEDPIIARTTADLPYRVVWEGFGAMGDKSDEKVVAKRPEGNTKKITRVYPPSESDDDAAMHRAVDGHGKGFFTLNEFLRYLGESKTPELVDYFNRYAKALTVVIIHSYHLFQTSLTTLSNIDTM